MGFLTSVGRTCDREPVTFTGVQSRLRERALASDRRAGSWARGEARRRQWKFVRENWRPLIVLALVLTVVTGTVLLLVPRGDVRSFFAGVFATSIIGTMMF